MAAPTSKPRAVDYRIAPFDLHLLLAVQAQGSITAAAAAVSLSLPATSARIKALEGAVGVRLLERSKAGAALTDAGRALVRHARRVLAELESLHIEMAGFGGGLRGTVRLLCNTAAMSEWLPARLGRFLMQHPDLDIDVQELPSDAVLDALRRGVADVGIVADHVDNTAGLITRPWLNDELVAVWPRAWPRAGLAGGPSTRARSIRFADLLDRPFVGLSRESGLSRFLIQQASRSGRVLHHRVRLSNFEAVVRVVAEGVGVAVMPRSAVLGRGDLSGQVKVMALADDWAQRQLLICTTEQGEAVAGVQLLIGALLAE